MKTMKGEITMTYKAIDRTTIIQQYLDKKLTQKAAAAILKLSTRHFRRLIHKFQKEGPQGLVSQHGNKTSNNTRGTTT